MKSKLLSLFAAIALMCVGINAYATDKTIETNGETCNYVLSGQTNNANDDVTVLLIKKSAVESGNVTPDDIGFVMGLESDSSGDYYKKFRFNHNASDYYIQVKSGDDDISNRIIEAKQVDTEPVEIELGMYDVKSGGLQIGLDLQALVKVGITNKFGDVGAYKLILAQYDENNRLISAYLTDNYEIPYQKDGSSLITDKSWEINPEAKNVKAFVIRDAQSFTPLCKAVHKSNYDSFGYNNLIDKNGSGELNAVFIGGSITEGSYLPSADKRWVNILSEEYFKTEYPNKTVNFYNAGVSATGSDYGELRLQKDVCEHNPDIVFVEFALNDGSPDSNDKRQMESIVRQLLRLPKQPVIVFVYTAGMKMSYSLGSNATSSQINYGRDCSNAKTAHEEVAEYYGIGSIDLDAYIGQLLAEKLLIKNWDDFSGDTVHPNVYGNRLYADYIANSLRYDSDEYIKKLSKGKPAYFGGASENVKLLEANDKRIKYTADVNFDYILNELIGLPTDVGSDEYGHIDVNDYTAVYKNWRYYKNVSANMPVGSELEFEFTGNKIGVLGFQNTKGLKAKYVIDEGTANEISGVMSTDWWVRLHQLLYINNLSDGQHTLKIQALDEHNAAYSSDNSEAYDNYFVIGYLLVDEQL